MSQRAAWLFGIVVSVCCGSSSGCSGVRFVPDTSPNTLRQGDPVEPTSDFILLIGCGDTAGRDTFRVDLRGQLEHTYWVNIAGPGEEGFGQRVWKRDQVQLPTSDMNRIYRFVEGSGAFALGRKYYREDVYDGGTTIFLIKVNERVKTVASYNNYQPEPIWEIRAFLDELLRSQPRNKVNTVTFEGWPPSAEDDFFKYYGPW